MVVVVARVPVGVGVAIGVVSSNRKCNRCRRRRSLGLGEKDGEPSSVRKHLKQYSRQKDRGPSSVQKQLKQYSLFRPSLVQPRTIEAVFVVSAKDRRIASLAQSGSTTVIVVTTVIVFSLIAVLSASS